MKRQANYWDTIFARHISDQGLIVSTIQKTVTNTSIEKYTEYLNRHFINENTWIQNKHMKKYSKSFH